MPNIHQSLNDLFTAIADAIRAKLGTSGPIVADQFPEVIMTISTGTDTSDATAGAGDILVGKTAYGASGKLTGSMPDNGAVSQALNAGGSYTIPSGYHSGAGKVTANSLASQTSGTATAADIASGKTAWVNGVQLTGSASSGVIKMITDDDPAFQDVHIRFSENEIQFEFPNDKVPVAIIGVLNREIISGDNAPLVGCFVPTDGSDPYWTYASGDRIGNTTFSEKDSNDNYTIIRFGGRSTFESGTRSFDAMGSYLYMDP